MGSTDPSSGRASKHKTKTNGERTFVAVGCQKSTTSTNTNTKYIKTQMQIHKYEYTNANTQMQIHKYTNTNRMHCGVAVGCQKKQRKWAMAAMRVTNGCTPSRAHRGKPGPHLIWQQCDTIFSLCGLSVLIQIQIQYKYIVIQVCVLSAGL